ncbi:Hypothetical predicted protein [Cloeon dipterum]|uniref:Uncharacterized protein n=1 Tax=Cloeon dipterum TaxID=197152 RepID=A0A8S1D1V0_9INSE|nr:Hypothetical predicted protein [Cloeon dipterum]
MAHLRYLLMVFTTTVALVSSIPTIIQTNNLREDRAHNLETHISTLETDKFLATRYFIQQSDKLANDLWVDMENNKSAVYMPKFSEISKIVQLPYDFKIFGLNIREVKVMRKGGIRSANPNLQWSAIPLRIKTFDEFAPCPIRYRFDDVSFTIQWEYGYHNCQKGTELSVQLKIHNDIANNFGVSYKYKVPGTNDTFILGPQLTVNETVIRNNTVIVVYTLPLCSNFQDSRSCLVDARNASLSCFWCPKIGICSSTEDFLKNVWKDNDCGNDNNYLAQVKRQETYFRESIIFVVAVVFFGLGATIYINYDDRLRANIDSM